MPHGFSVVFCLVLAYGHWFDHGGHFETETDKLFWLTQGLQVTRSRGALLQWKMGWPWIFEPTNGPLEGSAWPGLVQNVSSLFKSFFYPLNLTLRHIKGVCHISSGSGLQPLDNQHFSLRVNLRHVFRGLVAVEKVYCTGVLFIHTWDLIDPLLVTGEAHITRRQHLCLGKNWLNGLYQAVNIRILFVSFVLHWNIITKAVGIKMTHFL